MIRAKILADSVNLYGDRLTTLEVEFPRFILAEFNTHRMLSRNSASSRAIPTSKILERVMTDPFIPQRFPVNKPGMSATEYYEQGTQEYAGCVEIWLEGRDYSVETAKKLAARGVHKQITNRLLEDFMWHTVIVSATSWQNFWNLRISPMAQPEINATAIAMKEAMDNSWPRDAHNGDWHLPLIGFPGDENLPLDLLKKVSVARVARVSYLTHDGVRDVEADISLYDRLIGPGHWSPFEHVAEAGKVGSGNFTGWYQLRHYLEKKVK